MRDAHAIPEPVGLSTRLIGIFDRLFAAYGPQDWWPGEGGFETIVGAILTQSAAWSNVERALDRLRAEGALTPAQLLAMSEERLAELIRPSGYFNSKARKLIAFCRMIETEFEGNLDRLLGLGVEELRARLLATYGIGPETADAIILYAAKLPSFVVDAYTRRILGRIGIMPAHDDYESWRSMFMGHLSQDTRVYNEYHALIVHHAKVSCTKQPACSSCVLRCECLTADAALGAA
jgi:endonuclease-3 related protein